MQSQQSQEEKSSLIQTFLYSIKSKETQKTYLFFIDYFEKWNKRKIEDLLKLNVKTIEEIIIQYIVAMRDKQLSYSSIKVRLSALTAFLDLNDVTINHKKLRKFMGENTRTVKDEAYSRDDLLKMFQHATFRTKVIISIYSSTGIRKTALVDLKLRHLKKIKVDACENNIYKFTIYENTKDEYITFCTPECASLIDEYLAQRKAAGETITDESYLIRNDFDFVFKARAKQAGKITTGALDVIMKALLHKTELRQVNYMTENSKYKRHPKAGFHAFRKYFNTCLVNADVNVTFKEMLMGHSVGLDDCYFKPSEKQLLAEYLKAVNELTVSPENRLKKRVTELESKQSEIDVLKYQQQLMNDRLDKAGLIVEDIKKMLFPNG